MIVRPALPANAGRRDRSADAASAGLTTSARSAHARQVAPFLVANPFGGLSAYAPYWPAWYDTPPIVVNNLIPLPVPAPAPVMMLPLPPPELRTTDLHVPLEPCVLAGREVDAAAIPVILESPVLQEGQAYAFDVR